MAARAQDEGAQLCLTTDEVAALVPAITHGWVVQHRTFHTGFGRAIRLFTLGEGQFSAGRLAQSAVIKLVRIMKARKEMTPELSAGSKRIRTTGFCHMAI